MLPCGWGNFGCRVYGISWSTEKQLRSDSLFSMPLSLADGGLQMKDHGCNTKVVPSDEMDASSSYNGVKLPFPRQAFHLTFTFALFGPSTSHEVHHWRKWQLHGSDALQLLKIPTRLTKFRLINRLEVESSAITSAYRQHSCIR